MFMCFGVCLLANPAFATDISITESRLTAFQITESSPVLPNDGVSFTSLAAESTINLAAQISPTRFHSAYSAQIQWIVDDDPLVTGASPDVTAPANGASTSMSVAAIPLVSAGRGYPLNYRIRAKVEIDGGVAIDTRTIKQDEIDQARQEYIDMNKVTKPARTEFTNSGQSSGGHFTFAELNTGDFSWAIVKAVLYSGLEATRSNIGNQAIGVTSGYRNPRHNYLLGGAAESRHIYGDAADMHVADFNGDGVVDTADWNLLATAAQNAGATYIEPYELSPDHVHADWR